MGRYRRYKKRNNEITPYQAVAFLSFSFRAYLCYLTIDNILIVSDPLKNQILLEVFSLYTILWAISRITTGFFYNRGIDSPYKGAGIYFLIYIFYLFVLYMLMLILTFLKVLPLGI